MSKPFNQWYFNNVYNISSDGSRLLIKGGYENGKWKENGFSYVYKTSKGWTSPVKINIRDFVEMDKGNYDGASVSIDGKVMFLYFSEKTGGEDMDIYVSFMIDSMNWTRPQKLEPPVNSIEDEITPFIDPDNRTLYFASDRNSNNYDIYYCIRLDDTWLKWSEPFTMGRVINTVGYEAFFSTDTAGVYAYYVTDKNAIGESDIVKIKIKEPVIHVPMFTLNGIVKDIKTNIPVKAIIKYRILPDGSDSITSNDENNGEYKILLHHGVKYEFVINTSGYQTYTTQIDLSKIPKLKQETIDFYLTNEEKVQFDSTLVLSGKVININSIQTIEANVTITDVSDNSKINNSMSGKDGFSVHLLKGKTYQIYVKANGFIDYSDSINVKLIDNKEVTRNIMLSPIEVGKTVVLNNIFFDFDKTTLKPESYIELDKVVKLLNENPGMKIEIAGHTDNVGSDVINLRFSSDRASAVKDYIVSKGISSERIIAKGYGPTKPISSNDSEEGRRQNRRVEFTILKK